MIFRLDKDISELKIGIVGTRSNCFAKILDKEKIKYEKIKVKDINKSYDLVFESGLYRIIPPKILNLPQIGVFGTHETPLPEGRGFCPLQWSVLNKREHIVVTLYKLNENIDDGKIVNQIYAPIERLDTIEILDQKRKEAISQGFQLFIDELRDGTIVLRDQTGVPSYSPQRTPDSCELDTQKKLIDLWDDIRICDNEKYPAWFKIDGKKVVLKYEID